ncbi:MAG: tetratricopeptide repeat protein [Planctomycetaceae bacterium]
MARGKSDRNRQQKLERQKRKRKERLRELSSAGNAVSAKTDERLGVAYRLIDDRDFEDAEELLRALERRRPRNPAIAEALVYLYQRMNDHESCCVAARKLMHLTPDDPDALTMYAQESLYCNRVSLALVYYRQVMERWPDHPNSAKASEAQTICLPEARKRLQDARDSGFTDLDVDNGGLELFAQHESSLERLHNGDFEGAIRICDDLLATEPRFISARNNLVTCLFQTGQTARALDVVRETRRLIPENRYAEALAGKIMYLCGDPESANEIADHIVAHPPDEQDPLLAALELLSYMGRDQDVLNLCESIDDRMDLEVRAMAWHYEAVARCRLGEIILAKSLWKKCLRELPKHPTARENLEDLNSNGGNAPWAESLGKWIPKSVLDRVLNPKSLQGNGGKGLLQHFPAIAMLIPALLDRGDPFGRELAVRIAGMDASPKSVEALREFAFSNRGADSLRSMALVRLKELGALKEDSVRYFSRGEWRDISMWSPEITDEVDENIPEWESELALEATNAGNDGDRATAERLWKEILKRNPDSVTARFNIAVTALRLGGKSDQEWARKEIEDIHRDHPDYAFGIIAAAQLTAKKDCDRAREMLKPIMQKKRLHVSEATALFAAFAQISLQTKDIAEAERMHEMLVGITSPDHPTTAAIADLIAQARTRSDMLDTLRKILPRRNS